MTFRSSFLTRAAALCTLALWATAATAQPAPCTDGYAGAYACEGLDLHSHISLAEFGSTSGNDIWGWTDPETGREYALMGLRDGTAFVDITAPASPAYLGKLVTSTEPSLWRDIKVYDDHAFIVSEAPGHGMQVFDLTQLRGLSANPDHRFTAGTTYTGTGEMALGSAHNIVINETSGYAYAVGAGECAGGLYAINIQNPMQPSFEGCFAEDGYTHDAQCVTYEGPDSDYSGREICVNSNEDTITIVDMTDKANPVMLGKGEYPSPAYTHQGWFTEDHRYFLVDDELDEIQGFSDETRTFVFDLADLGSPELLEIYTSGIPSSDHNMYVLGDRVYQANYTSGLRVLDLTDIASGELTEVAAFDIYPETDDAQFNGAWSVYPYFESGSVIISGIEGGLFVVRPAASGTLALNGFDVQAEDGAAVVTWTPSANSGTPFMLQGRRDGESYMNVTTMQAGASRPYRYRAEALSPGRHEFRVVQLGADGSIMVSPIASVEIDAPSTYRLSNTFTDAESGTSHVALTLSEDQQVSIELFDASDRRLKTIYDDMLDAGIAHMFEVGGPGLPAGRYMIRITGETFDETVELSR